PLVRTPPSAARKPGPSGGRPGRRVGSSSTGVRPSSIVSTSCQDSPLSRDRDTTSGQRAPQSPLTGLCTQATEPSGSGTTVRAELLLGRSTGRAADQVRPPSVDRARYARPSELRINA